MPAGTVCRADDSAGAKPWVVRLGAKLRRRMGVTAVREFARHRLRRAAYVGVPRAVVEQMMQQEAMRVRLHGQPAAEPPYADFFA